MIARPVVVARDMVIPPVLETEKKVEVALAVELEMAKRTVLVSPVFALMESLAYGEVVAIPMLPEVDFITIRMSPVIAPLSSVTNRMSLPSAVSRNRFPAYGARNPELPTPIIPLAEEVSSTKRKFVAAISLSARRLASTRMVNHS